MTEWEDKQAEAEAETVDANETIEAAENIVSNWENGCAIEHEKTRAYYSPLEDTIGMPNLADFETPPAYYSTLFHEMTHATGHHSRLNRFSETEPVGTFGSASYSKEELAAEMGASFLAAEADIDPALFLDNSTAYINGWLDKIKGDSKLVIYAASQAQKSTDSILNRVVVASENKKLSKVGV